MTTPSEYRVTPPIVPPADRSGDIGRRLLTLLSVQAARNLKWVAQTSRQEGIAETDFVVPSGEGMRWPLHALYNAATSASVFAVLARFGDQDSTMGGISRETMEQMATAMIRAVIDTHPVSGSGRVRLKWWKKFWALRMDYIFGVGAWLLWDKLAAETQLLIARILEHDADLFNQDQAPALLYDDTQAETNAWFGSGLALAFCMLQQHPRRELWGEKAKEFMIGAYATAADVQSSRVVDGRPLNQWLHAPNAFWDYTVENHGFIHPIYIAAVSEMVRTAFCYRLAEEPVPQAATFNADHVLDTLIRLNLPDGNHLYVQGTDYDPRRLDSFLQACNVIPLAPDPLREACFLRVLGNMETIASERPDMLMNGDLFSVFDFGTSWGLDENYMMRRLFGSPATAIPQEQIESRLTGVHVNEPGKFALHRTAKALSSFSWHAIDRSSQVMAVTMPLDKDVLCHAESGAYIGDVTQSPPADARPLRVLFHKVHARQDGFGVTLELERCGGKVLQNCAFVSLPDGRSVYLEERRAKQTVSIASARSGTVRIYDDPRWPFQKHSRVFHCVAGPLRPEDRAVQEGNWLNVDDRMGYAALGTDHFALAKSTDLYHSWRLSFLHRAAPQTAETFEAGSRISVFALVSCPNQAKGETEKLAARMSERGWHAMADGLLALAVSPYIVYANFSTRSVADPAAGKPRLFEARTATWVLA